MYRFWLKERNRAPNVLCPIEEDGTIVLGMNLITDHPPGKVVGEFWINERGEIECETYPTTTAHSQGSE